MEVFIYTSICIYWESASLVKELLKKNCTAFVQVMVKNQMCCCECHVYFAYLCRQCRFQEDLQWAYLYLFRVVLYLQDLAMLQWVCFLADLKHGFR